jgi:hypothetical protein
LALSLLASCRPAIPPSRTPLQTTSKIVFPFRFFFRFFSFVFFRLLASSLAASLSLDELELFDLARAFFFFFFALLKTLMKDVIHAQTSHNIDCALDPLCYIRACSI